MKKPTEEWRFLIAKRAYKSEKRFAKELKTNSLSKIRYDSAILTYWAKNSRLQSGHDRSRLNIYIPKIFSIIDAPEFTLDVFSQLVAVARSGRKVHKIVVDHSRMSRHDLAAEILLGFVVKEIEREYKSRNRKFDIQGHYPRDAQLIKYIRAIGVVKDLNIKSEQVSKEQQDSLQIFMTRNKILREGVEAGAANYSEIAARKLVDYINNCLSFHDKELTPEAVDKLAEYSGELLANADEHGGLRDWNMRGYYDLDEEQHMCEIMIFNFGKTIADTFVELDPNSFAYRTIAPYLEQHTKSGFFTPQWSKECLITLAALQGDISSKNTSKNSDRGQGTVEMIEFFQSIHEECTSKNFPNASMAILSGSTHIKFDGKYSMIRDAGNRKIIAFNEENSLLIPPDPNYVRSIAPRRFPGTIISIKFALEDSQMKSVDEIISQ